MTAQVGPGKGAPIAGRTAVYRFFDADDVLLYVGIATNVTKRWRQHENAKNWWHLIARSSVTWFESRSGAEAEEARSVDEERPLYNARKHPEGGWEQLRYDDSADLERAHLKLQCDLADGTLLPGQRIFVTRLASQYGVSASTLRWAFELLPIGTFDCSRKGLVFVAREADKPRDIRYARKRVQYPRVARW
ncbi:GIY-YIG nuclease family protein [Streptomyces indicus]|uniref:Regulatory protein, gntR family n=1 Tax=Streptomyces indicus TaxID=417292 RepID=A0A1G9IT43_9ACTN|nr:GIY-YIG nuclease family protein [Streptomyces indicus]SDL28519.1 regulatory protein, gntR family [Streptomyces indicus]